MKHRGEIIEQAVRQSGYTITKLAKRMGKSRRHVYNLFENPHVSMDVVLEIGKIIHHDFTALLPSSPAYVRRDQYEISLDEQHPYQQPENAAEYWKNKYLVLLEKYNALLEASRG